MYFVNLSNEMCIRDRYLAEWMKAYQKETDDYATSPYRKMSIMLMILSVVIIISNLYGLYTVSYTHLENAQDVVSMLLLCGLQMAYSVQKKK